MDEGPRDSRDRGARGDGAHGERRRRVDPHDLRAQTGRRSADHDERRHRRAEPRDVRNAHVVDAAEAVRRAGSRDRRARERAHRADAVEPARGRQRGAVRRHAADDGDVHLQRREDKAGRDAPGPHAAADAREHRREPAVYHRRAGGRYDVGRRHATDRERAGPLRGAAEGHGRAGEGTGGAVRRRHRRTAAVLSALAAGNHAAARRADQGDQGSVEYAADPGPRRLRHLEEGHGAGHRRRLHRRLHRPRERGHLAEGRHRVRCRRSADRGRMPGGGKLAALIDAPAIRTRDLAKRYGDITALAGLTMTIPRGDVFGFLGPNGAGKTTAVKILLGLTPATSGEGEVLGADIGEREARRRIGYLPELFRYQSWLTAREVLALHCELARIDRAKWSTEIDRTLATVGLADRGTSRVGTFSKGMQQRLGLGVALLDDPAVVLLDEPTSALDPVGRHDVREIIRALREKGTIVFLNSHLLSEVEQVCDAVAIVDRGKVVAQGDLTQLLRTSSVRVRATGMSREARVAMARFGELDDDADGAVLVKGIERERIPELVSAIVASGARVYAVESQHESLEERFLSLLGQ